MSNYIPNTASEQAEMLSELGLSSIDELFGGIPSAVRMNGRLDLPAALSEYELAEHIKAIAAMNKERLCFAGGGIYDHFIPAVVSHITGRQEFYTAYTPYQAEISQGTLQAIFEYQTMICALTGMDVSNASMYDGATACAEALLMANAVNGRKDIIILESVNPEYMDVCKTYAEFRGINIITVPFDKETGTADINALRTALECKPCAVLAQSPNFFGVLEDFEEIGAVVKESKTIFIAVVDPISLGILEKPEHADIVVGEGQSMGNPMSFGGPGFGFFACKKEYMRKMPGRIAGQTTDAEGKRGFVLTIQAREQHIRREKATSNICSNHAINALAASVYLSVMGASGLRTVAELSMKKARYMYNSLLDTGMFEPVFDGGVFFKEFALKYRRNLKELMKKLNCGGFIPGIELSPYGIENGILIAITEKRTKEQIDRYVKIAGEGGN